MSILIIEGDPGSISDLIANLEYRNYLEAGVVYYKVLPAPDIITEDKWSEFLSDFKQLIEEFDFPGIS